MEKFNKIFKKVFAVLIVFALLFAMNVKADENAGQVDNQYSQTEEKQKEIETAPPSSVPPETVSQAGDNQTLTTGENNKPVVVETTPGGGDNLTTPGDDTSKVDEVDTSKQTTLDTPTEGNDDDKKELPKVEETLEKSDDVQAQITPTEGTDETITSNGDETKSEAPSAPVEKQIDEPKTVSEPTRGDVPTTTETSNEAQSEVEPQVQLLGAGSGAKAAGDSDAPFAAQSKKSIKVSDILTAMNISDYGSISDVQLGSTLLLEKSGSGNDIEITPTKMFSTPVTITVTTTGGEETYTIELISVPAHDKSLTPNPGYDDSGNIIYVDDEGNTCTPTGADDDTCHVKGDGTYKLSLSVIGEAELDNEKTGGANIVIIYDL